MRHRQVTVLGYGPTGYRHVVQTLDRARDLAVGRVARPRALAVSLESRYERTVLGRLGLRELGPRDSAGHRCGSSDAARRMAAPPVTNASTRMTDIATT